MHVHVSCLLYLINPIYNTCKNAILNHFLCITDFFDIFLAGSFNIVKLTMTM